MRIQLDESDLRDAVTDWCTTRGIDGVVSAVKVEPNGIVVATVDRHPEYKSEPVRPLVSSSSEFEVRR